MTNTLDPRSRVFRHIYWLLLLFAPPVLYADARVDFEQHLRNRQRLSHLVFPIELSDGERPVMFDSYLAALEVLRVTVDGFDITQRTTGVTWHSINSTVVPVEAKAFFYVVPVEEGLLFSRSSAEGPEKRELVLLRFPDGWKRLEMEFKMHSPGGGTSRKYSMRLLRKSDPIEIEQAERVR